MDGVGYKYRKCILVQSVLDEPLVHYVSELKSFTPYFYVRSPSQRYFCQNSLLNQTSCTQFRRVLSVSRMLGSTYLDFTIESKGMGFMGKFSPKSEFLNISTRDFVVYVLLVDKSVNMR